MVSSLEEKCIFCEIVKREEKASIVYEDDDILAFLDINPLAKGHTLIIPKKHYVDITDIPPEMLSKISLVSKKLGENLINKLGYDGVNLMHSTGASAGQSVFHFHVHLIPRISGESIGFQEWWFSRAFHPSRKDLDKTANDLKL